MPRRLRTYLESCQQIEPVEIGLLVPSENQIRSNLGDLGELCASIRELGLLMPILVRPKGSRFEVICGNRRLEACKLLMKRHVDCVVRDLSDQVSFEVSIVENVQRQTLSPLEEAGAFQKYVYEFGWGGISNLASRVGKSEEYVSHRILLLNLPTKILDRLQKNQINPSQAQELLWFKQESTRDKVLNQMEKSNLSVAEIRLIRKELEHRTLDYQKLDRPNSEYTKTPNHSRPADSNPDFEFGEALSNRARERSDNYRDSRAIDEAILALRVALVRLDSAISKCQSRRSRNLLMSERLALHDQVDRIIREKVKMPT